MVKLASAITEIVIDDCAPGELILGRRRS